MSFYHLRRLQSHDAVRMQLSSATTKGPLLVTSTTALNGILRRAGNQVGGARDLKQFLSQRIRGEGWTICDGKTSSLFQAALGNTVSNWCLCSVPPLGGCKMGILTTAPYPSLHIAWETLSLNETWGCPRDLGLGPLGHLPASILPTHHTCAASALCTKGALGSSSWSCMEQGEAVGTA